MENVKSHPVSGLLFACALMCLLISCGSDNNALNHPIGVHLYGEAQGTTYSITYLGDTLNYQHEIDSLLDAFDLKFSNWSEGSLVNRINAHSKRDSLFAFVDSSYNFGILFDMSRDLHRITEGAFDPTVYPLVEAWGFGLKNREDMNQEKVDSLLNFVGFNPSTIDLIELEDDNGLYESSYIRKGKPQARLDFNAIAQGYSVDLVADLLESRGITDYMVEIGGEVLCKGVNPQQTAWKIAIDKPIKEREENEFQAVVEVNNRALATSGNYRKFYEIDGQRFSHSIDPRTGYPVQHNLLSATVMANSCALADAYATAFMVMGLEKTIEFLNLYPQLNLDVYLVFDNEGNIETVATEHMTTLISEE